MSDPHDPAKHDEFDLDHEAAHEGPIKTPKQLIAAVVASFVIPIGAILLLANYVDLGTRPSAGTDLLDPESVVQRVRPIGTVEVRDLNAPAVVHTGEQVYVGQCAACHNTGAAGAPKLGDTSAWSGRLAQGYEALLTAALKGKGAMPAQGGGEYADFEIGRAVVHMTNQVGAQFPVPAPPAAPASAAVAGADAAATPGAMAAPAAAVDPGAAATAGGAAPAAATATPMAPAAPVAGAATPK